jgi:hypothetical protein
MAEKREFLRIEPDTPGKPDNMPPGRMKYEWVLNGLFSTVI